MRLSPANIVVISIVAAATAAPSFAATEVARVNNQVITLEDLNQKFNQSLQYYQPNMPTKSSFLDDMIKKDLGVQEAKKMGLEHDPEVIDAMNTVLFNALIARKLGKEFQNINVSDSEAKDFYANNPEVRTSDIFVGAPASANPEVIKKAREKIQALYDEHIKPGKEDFAEVAQKYSEAANAGSGGDLGFRMKGSVDPAYYQAAVALHTPGRTSGIVRTQEGFYIIKLTAVHSWDEVDRPAVKRLLIVDRQHEAFDKYMKQLRSQANVTIRKDLLKE